MPALTHDRRFDPRHGEPVEVAPGVVRITAPNASPMTFHGTNTYLVGDDTVAVVDPGPALDAHVDAIVRAIAGGEGHDWYYADDADRCRRSSAPPARRRWGRGRTGPRARSGPAR